MPFLAPDHMGDVVVVVTGASTGIGATTCAVLLDQGAKVVGVGRRPTLVGLDDIAANPGFTYLSGDVRDRGTADAALSCAREIERPHLALVNNAGVDLNGPLLELTIDDLRHAMEVNFFGGLTMIQVFGKEMQARGGGNVVNVTSRLASVGVPGMGGYGATKGALAALTRHAAVELAASGVSVNDVAPGMTATPMYAEWLREAADPEAREVAVTSTIPAGRVAEPEDVAAAIAFLVSPRHRYITGTSIAVDGGYTAT